MLITFQKFSYYKKLYSMTKLTDGDPMPVKGKYKGVPMEDVPYWYLFWLEEQPYCLENVKQYIEENRDVLEVEQKRANKN